MSSSSNQHAKQKPVDVRKRKSKEPQGFVLFTIAIVALITAGYFLLIAPALSGSKPLGSGFELAQFELALKSYEMEFGAFPPGTSQDQIELHIRQFHRPEVGFDATGQSLDYNLDLLDERELLYFWLDGTTLQRLSGIDKDFEFFDFDSRRLVDHDNDGWLEYQDKSGNYFVLCDGKPVILEISQD